MDPVLDQIASHLKLGDYLLKTALENLSDEELHRRGGPQSNSMLWITGHLALSRSRMLKLAGGDNDFPWPDLFSRGSAMQASSDYPALDEVLGAWDEASGRLLAALPRMTPEQLFAKSPQSLPGDDKSVRGALSFLVYHEAYHIGQMGYLRKMLGYESLVG
jgi:uncharacterized damage-inducible protein DinB